MRLLFLIINLLSLVTVLHAQPYFPVKMEKKWGLMDETGKIVLNPEYDAIGAFEQYGYSVMQRHGGVGLLNASGDEIIAPKYEDLKVLDSTLVAVMDEEAWFVIDLAGNIILNKGYDRVHVWKGKYLAYLQNEQWGIAARDGSTLCTPQFDEIELLESSYFLSKRDGLYGLMNTEGHIILHAAYQEIRPYNQQLFFFRQGNKWGAVNEKGEEVLAPEFTNFQKISDNFLKLIRGREVLLYALPNESIIATEIYHNFYPFAHNLVLTKKNRQLGLIQLDGELILAPVYNEIHAYSQGLYRVKQNGLWGVVAPKGEIIIPFQYDYIAPLNEQVCVVKKGAFYGIVNFKGEEVVDLAYTKIELNKNEARAFKNEALDIFYFDEEGELRDKNKFKKHYTIRIGKQTPRMRRKINWQQSEDAQLLENFEWFYESSVDKWGLRRLDNGDIQIEPTYDWIRIERNLGFTIVGIEKTTYGALDRTDYRFEMLYGLVNNKVGMLTTLVNMWDIRMSDFEEGQPVARCIFENGRHGLIRKNGKIIRRDFAYIGNFSSGLARISMQGRLSANVKDRGRGLGGVLAYFEGFMAPYIMIDYTQFDQQLTSKGVVTCESCAWGYMDTLGQIIVDPIYTAAKDFVHNIGIVEDNGKWGALDRSANILIPCTYDKLDFLENTDNQILKISNQLEKYGLLDTLGQLTISLMYEDIGTFSENRLAVKHNGKWGFVNQDGTAVIPCEYKTVRNFSDGLAIVKKDRKWGAINKFGDVLVDFEHSQLSDFKNNLAVISAIGGKGYINSSGALAIKAKFQRAYEFEEGVARVVENGKYGLIDTDGNYILRPNKYSDIAPFDEHGLAIVRYGNNHIRYGVIDQNGDLLTSRPFQSIAAFKEGYAIVRYKGKYGYINTLGALVIPTEYSKASSFSEGRAAVQKEGVCGYINIDGQAIVNFEYSKCLDFNEGKAVVYKGYKKAGLIDPQGHYIIEPSINRLLDFTDGRGLVRDSKYRFYYITEQARLYEGYYENASEFQNGVAVVQIDGRWGIINQKGIEIIPPKYDKIEKFEAGYAKVRITTFSGLANLEGELIVPPDYEYISYAGNNLFRVEQGDKIGYFDTEGAWIWPLQN